MDFNNSGTLDIQSGTLSVSSTSFNNTGLVNLAAGRTLNLAANGTGSGDYVLAAGAAVTLSATQTLNAGADISGAGTFTVAGGTLSLAAATSIDNLVLTTSGTLTGAGALTVDNSLVWSGGTMSGAGSTTVPVGTALTLDTTTQNLILNARSFTNNSTSAVWSGNNAIQVGGGAVFTNAGSLSATGNGSLTNFGSSLGTFNNTGTLTKTTGTGTTTVTTNGPVDFNNSGTLDIQSGTLSVSSTSFVQSGTVVLGSGTTLSRANGFTNTGILRGNGTIDVSGGALTNSGTIRPDGSGADPTGVLTITGDFTQSAGGTLDMQSEGTSAGLTDVLAISGAATLGGTLALTPVNSFLPGAGEQYPLVTYGSHTGSFATINAPAFDSLAAAYGTNGIVFTTAGACSVDVCWIGTSGDWGTGSNWSTGAAPSTGQRVRISVAGSHTVTMASGTYNLLDVDSDENLTFSGGAMSVTGLFSLTGGTTLGISGAALTVTGALNASILNLSAGSLGGSGTITVSTDFNHTGGTFNPTGSLDLTRSLGTFNFSAFSTSAALRLATLGANDIQINGNLQATGANLTLDAGRDIRIGSTANLSTVGSGAITLSAARDVDLKVNDGGGSNAANSISAAGNLAITTTTGQIVRTDGDLAGVSASTLSLSAATSIGAFGNITATGGAATLNAGTTLSTSGFTVSATGPVAMTAGGTLSVSTVNASGAASDITLTSTGANISGGTLGAGNDIAVTSVTGLTMGAVTAGTGGNGTVTLTNAGAGSDITLNGTVQATNAALADTAAAITANSGRDIRIGSTSNLSALTSGAIVLTAARDVDLKVNDGGGSNAANSISAAGNVAMTATGGQITRTDGDAVSASARSIDAVFGSTLDGSISLQPTNALNLTRSSGDLLVGSYTVPALNLSAPGGNVAFAPGATFGGGQVTVSGSGSAMFPSGTVVFNSDFEAGMPIAIGGASVQFNGQAAAPSLSMTSGTASFQVGPVLPELALSAGTLSIAGNAPYTVTGGTWTVGGSSQLNLPANGAVIATGARLALEGGTASFGSGLAVQGTLELSSGALGGSGRITNTGTVSKTGAGAFTLTTPLDNQGTVDVVAGTLVLTGGGIHTGQFVAGNGSTLDFEGGTHQFANGAEFSGEGRFEGGGTLQITGTGPGLVLAAGTTTDLDLLGFSGSGRLTNRGTTSGNGTALAVEFVNDAGATANLTDVAIGGNLLNYGTIHVGGTVTVAGMQARQLGGVLAIPSGSTLDMSSVGASFSWEDGPIGGAGTLGFSGGGTFLFAGTGDRVIDGLNFAFNNLTLPDGSLTLQSGSLTLSGNTVLPAGVALNLVGGTLTNNGSLDVGGEFSLTGGAFGGPGSLSMSGGSLSLPSGNSVAWTNSGALTNTGTLNLAGSTITNAIDNQGTINLGGGLNFTQTLTNRGTLNVQSGTSTFNSGVTQQSGDVVLSGGTLQGDLTLNAGSLRGNGTVDGTVTLGTVNMSPGASPGKLMVTGTLVLNAASVVNIELAGTTPTSGYDWIEVGGTATLAGTLNVSQISGFSAPAGSSFSVLQFASSTGAFSSVSSVIPSNLTVSYTPTSVLLAGIAPVLPIEQLAIVSPLAVAIERSLLDDDLVTDLQTRVAANLTAEPEDEIEVEGCR